MKIKYFFPPLLLVLVLSFPLWTGVFFKSQGSLRDVVPAPEWDLPVPNAYDALSQLEGAADPLPFLDEAAEAEAFLTPSIVELDYNHIPDMISDFMSAVHASVDHAELLMAEGGRDAAKREIERTLVVTEMIQDAPGMLLQQLLAVKAKEELFLAAEAMSLDIDLSDYADVEEEFLNSLNVEFQLTITEIEKLRSAAPESWFQTNYHFLPLATMNLLSKNYQEDYLYLSSDCDEMLSPPLPVNYGEELKYFDFNSLGKVFVHGMRPNVEGLKNKKCEMLEFLIAS